MEHKRTHSADKKATTIVIVDDGPSEKLHRMNTLGTAYLAAVERTERLARHRSEAMTMTELMSGLECLRLGAIGQYTTDDNVPLVVDPPKRLRTARSASR